MCDTRIEDLLTQISGRMGDEVGEDDRSTWTEIREEQKNTADAQFYLGVMWRCRWPVVPAEAS